MGTVMSNKSVAQILIVLNKEPGVRYWGVKSERSKKQSRQLLERPFTSTNAQPNRQSCNQTIYYVYSVLSVCLLARRGHQMSLQMAVSHLVIAGN